MNKAEKNFYLLNFKSRKDRVKVWGILDDVLEPWDKVTSIPAGLIVRGYVFRAIAEAGIACYHSDKEGKPILESPIDPKQYFPDLEIKEDKIK